MQKKRNRKVEAWLEDVFPKEKNVYMPYVELTARELSIVAAAALDAALAELLSRRLMNFPQKEQFLGVDGTPFAPAGTFTARMQLALLTGVIADFEFDVLRLIQKLRNLFAHRVNISMADPQVIKLVLKLRDHWMQLGAAAYEKRVESEEEAQKRELMLKMAQNLEKWIAVDADFGRIPIFILLGTIQRVWSRLDVPRIEGVGTFKS